jgi:hypothetical protein
MDNKTLWRYVDFDPEKLRKSLVKSGAGELSGGYYIKSEKKFSDGITTKKFINVLCFVEKKLIHMRRDII